MWLLYLLLLKPIVTSSVDLLPANVLNVCPVRPTNCNLLCPYGYLRDVLQQCLCTCAIDPCQTTICGPSESCIAIGVKARCIPKFGSNREECPRLTGGVCALRCEKDSDCNGRLICCSNGCGRECVAPIAKSFPISGDKPIQPVSSSSNIPGSFQRLIKAVSNIGSTHFNITPIPPTIRNLANTLFPTPSPIRPLPTTKVGQCPSPTESKSACSDQKQCANDLDCGNVDKCCPNACGSTCMEPLKATGCIHMVLAISKLKERRLPNEYVPFCERNGRFSSIQCDIQFCWCVDVHYGTEIDGTRISREQRRMDMCREPRLCAKKCHNQCTHGHIMDIFGCPISTCACLDICLNVKCENSWEQCQLVEPDCANPPCLPVPRCLLNPCRHGPPSRLANGITALCSSDKDCTEGTCSKIGYNGLGFCCSGPASSTRDGRCPSQPADKRKCLLYPENSCHSDHECSEDEKCCFNGCTLSCTQPEDYVIRKPVKPVTEPIMHYQPGDVEKYNKGHLSSLVADCADVIVANISCTTECHSDSQCAGMKRCCRQGCSTNCMYPIRSTPCFHLALTAELYSLRNAMKCDRAGNFEQYQCDDEGCFCVDIATGEELPGSRAIGRKPNCESRNPCEPLVCKVACPFGFEKGPNSCPTCKCKNPCEEVKCPQGSVCVMSSVQCYQTGNCVPQPRCVLNLCPTGEPYISSIGNVESCTKDEECPSSTHWCHRLGMSSGGVCCPSPARVRHAGSCPTVPISLDARMCRVSCKVDDDCNGHQKCCFDGCGAACRDITTPLIEISKEIFEKQGTCISEQRVLCNRLEKNTCEYDTDCAGVAKCCDDGCVKACAYPLQTSKCLVRKTNLQKMGQMDLIKCRPDGSFEQIQCDTEFCWCVDEEGNYVDGTRTGEDVTPNCPEPCEKLECGPIGCEYGHKKDTRGCATCECVDPCEGVTCPDDSLCVPTTVPCVTKPCPTIPRCVINPCPVSESVKNETTLHLKKCYRSTDCFDPMMTTHCSMLTQDFGFCCTAESPEVHTGFCPKITELNTAKVEKCVQECKTDSDCDQTSKCCWNGCGLTCVTSSSSPRPITSILQSVSESHFGDCLNVAPLGAFCLQRPTIADCKNDDDCPSLYKCCSDGCVMRCTQPNRAPLCVHQRIAALTISESEGSESNEKDSAVFVPECDASGNFDEVQSHFGLMWCVDKLGQEISGTKSTRVPNCDNPRPCPTRVCAVNCPYGFKSDNEGCPICDCISPCEYMNCPAGNVCRMMPVKCSSKECRPVAKCIPNMCGSGEPLALENYLLATCSLSSPCPAGFHCKSSGYADVSFCCSTPELAQKSLRCPVIPVMIASVDGSSCVVGCRHHYDCTHSSCCFNGCGTSCQFETRQQPIKPIRPSYTSSSKPPKTTRRPILSSLKIEKKASKIQNVIVEHHAVLPVSPVLAKLGTCPKLLINPGCTEQCSQDSECHGFLKCCTASCGTMCSAPRIATSCIHRLIAFESNIAAEIVNLIIPPVQCTPEGLFRRYQCDARINQCWCVDIATGVEEIGTRMFTIGLQPPDCDLPKICQTKCMESQCPYGIRTDGSGCPANGVCECNNICNSFNCPLNMECALRRVECTSNPCPDVPFCVEVQCPIPQRDLYRNVILCENDGGCGKNSKCVTNPKTERGICCHQKATQSSVLNLISPAIAASVPDAVETTTVVERVNHPMVVEAVPMSLSTNCTTMRIALEYLHQNGAILKSPLPLCSKNGNYERTQCDNKRCWCVDELSGEEIHGTRKKKTKNACKSQSMCLSKCSASLCPYGLLLDSIGCPRSECICKSACEHVDCPNGQVCILRRADCPNKWCLPVPTCEKSPCNSGLRPLIETRTRQQYSCTQNTVCPMGYYCTAFDDNMHGVCCPGATSIKSIGEHNSLSCPHGDPFSSLSDGTPLSCTVLTNGCPATHYCSTMPGQKSGICCVSKRYVCNLRRDAGPCTATVTRFFYSSLAHTCAPFDYGGCSGNLNNFATRDDCDNFCAGIGLDLSSPYDHASAPVPTESYQIAFSLSGGKIPISKMEDAEIQLINLLVDRFKIPRGSIEDVILRDDNAVKFTIRDVEARKFAREVSEKVSTGELNMTLAGQKLIAEPHTLTALHVSNERGTRNTSQVILYAILLASSIFLLCVICLVCFSCFCYYRNQPKDRANTPSNTTAITDSRSRQSGLRRVFSREDVSVCSDFNRPPMHDVSMLNRERERPPRSQSWLSIG
ncbi:hypothetical protein B9Z55_013866 [Caenorhabditis nigoni]|uniref:Uncharacterized protein n=1 Tax=Caenorhabditis nigoni TaxID=1611254 RepID=A0A2G5U3K4_9PELO|nr:hypothetical protein B9Z55_013866 [Caenorhabditis nigoni]